GLRTNQRAAPPESLARQHAAEFVAQALVLAEQESDLAAADADVAGRHVRVGTDVPAQLRHEALTKMHDLVVAPTLRIEIRSALAAAHRQRRQRVLQDLLEREEFENAQVDGGMKPQSALVGTDRAVHLDPETAVDLDAALIVLPWNAEHDDALRLD